MENALGLRDWAKENDAELIVTASKDGSDSGVTLPTVFCCVLDDEAGQPLAPG